MLHLIWSAVQLISPKAKQKGTLHCTTMSTIAADPPRSEMEIEEEEEEEENSPVPEVAMTVPTTDDPTLPALTFRMWVLGCLSCAILAFLNMFFWYRSQPLNISSLSAQVIVVPIGHFLARVLPKKSLFAGTRMEFSLNPGPFTVKEHVLITIFANSGAGTVYAIHIVTIIKAFYLKNIGFFVSFLVILTTQMLGFGWAGVFRRYLVLPAEMWWPSNLVQVSLFGALHEKEKRPKGGFTKNQFFIVAFLCSFAYYTVPGYLFPMVTSLSWICWAYPKSVFAHQLGSGFSGLGLGAVGFDWATITSFLGSPMASPWFATANVAAGFVLVMYVMTPIAYWSDLYKAKTFPIFSNKLFTASGGEYNISAIINGEFKIDLPAYEKSGPLYISTFFAMSYGMGFATLTATLVHVALFHGRDIAQLTRSAIAKKREDVHTRLMSKYEQVPGWWFWILLLVVVSLSLFACGFYNEQLQLPWWGVILSCLVAFIFTLPIGIINATTNQAPGLNVITEYVIGYIYPGRPVANVMFKTYGYISMSQALTFLADFKLGHYMKIPPRSMFIAQVAGTVLAGTVYLTTAWWLLESIPHICDTKLMPKGSPWLCRGDHVFYDASVIWGLIGPKRIFGPLGAYPAVNWYFLAGAAAPALVYLAHRAFPSQKWIRLVNMPVLLGATAVMPPATAVNFSSWLICAFVSGYVVLRRYPAWWKRHNYLLSGALDVGVAFMGVLLFAGLQRNKIGIDWWGGDGDGCPLASCPTAPGVEANPACYAF